MIAILNPTSITLFPPNKKKKRTKPTRVRYGWRRPFNPFYYDDRGVRRDSMAKFLHFAHCVIIQKQPVSPGWTHLRYEETMMRSKYPSSFPKCRYWGAGDPFPKLDLGRSTF